MTDNLLEDVYSLLTKMSDSEFANAASGEFCEDLKAMIEGAIGRTADRIEDLQAQLKNVLDREAETHRRHDAKVETQAAEIEHLKDVYSSATECFLEAQAEIEQLRKVLKALYFDDYYGIWDDLSANGCCHGFKPAKDCPNEGCRHGELQTNIEAALGETE